jgi:RimJ/RimL family protein N-acetyltransferase
MKISVREMVLTDIEMIVDYFVNADSNFLKGMGADIDKLPEKQEWINKLELEYKKPFNKKEFYYIIWMVNNIPIGHSNVNNIKYGQSATMHIHLWTDIYRKHGLGFGFLKLTIPYYIENLNLKKIVCEPYSRNVAPNKLLMKAGFAFIKEYETIPGWINFIQLVKRYELSKEGFERLESN